MIEIIPMETPTLGDRSYLVTDGTTAFVVDPQRDIDRMLEPARSRDLRITHVFETHIHNDYVTGGPALAEATGAAYHVNADDPVRFEHSPVRDGDVIEVGPRMRVRALATPGHTHTHLSYVLESGGEAVAVFTGGSLLYGSTGRPDLLGPDHTDALARAQHRTARRLADELPDDTEVYPTHGFGSFCSSTQSDATRSTIGRERKTNPVLTQDEREYVETLLAGLDAYPAYYAHMSPRNLDGPGAPDLSEPRRADAAELRRRLQDGEWVVDLRSRKAFAAGHLGGAFNFGLDGSFATYLGWLIPWGTPVSLLAETPDEIAEAQRELVRIGIERPASAASGDPSGWTGGAPLSEVGLGTFDELAAVRHHRTVTVLDVRRNDEWRRSHLPGAVHVPLHELLSRLDEVPEGEVWVHCATGYRSAIAGSFLAAAGRRVVVVDDDFANAAPYVRKAD
ncbi:MBL fold metallo-hydrolase [Actinocorallia libanotica]|uniref:MBL fold metallo-hydrolase n=1 Tax=Actinocorallia libanotica TaxID=46162 RepID=A0ABN1R457_9ACTN